MFFNRVASCTFSRWHRPWEEGEEPGFGVRQAHVPMWLLELLASPLAEPELQAGNRWRGAGASWAWKETGKGRRKPAVVQRGQSQRKGL